MRSFGLPLTATTLFPARLARLTRRDGPVLRIAEAETSITVAAETFVPLPGCEIMGVKHILGGEMPSLQINFAHAAGGTIDTFDLNVGLWDGAEVILYVVDRDNLTTLGDPLFTGSIQPVTINPIGATGSFDIRGLGARAESVIQRYSPMCRTDLFSSTCQVDPDAWDHTGTVGTIIDRFNITVAGLGAPPADGWFNQGTGETASGIKFEIGNWIQSTLQLTTYLPLGALFTAGEALTLWPGCDKTMGDNGCGKFSNYINFQGEPHFLGAQAMLEG
jgi:uncharacterized phage protein (TIGR02218 family)